MVVVRQAPLSIGFPRKEHWTGLPLPSPGHLPDPEVEPALLHWQADSLQLTHLESPTEAQHKGQIQPDQGLQLHMCSLSACFLLPRFGLFPQHLTGHTLYQRGWLSEPRNRYHLNLLGHQVNTDNSRNDRGQVGICKHLSYLNNSQHVERTMDMTLPQGSRKPSC